MDNTGARPLRILIVDDNEDAADSLATLLELRAPATGHGSSRYDVRVAYNGVAGLRAAREFTPDCLISDIGMPGMDGYSLARAVRGEPELAGVKLVALSAYSDPEHVRRTGEAGFDYRLTKASNIEDVLEVLRMVEEIKYLAARTRELAEHNVNIAGETKELLQEVKDGVKELQQDVAELREDIKEIKSGHANGSNDSAAK